MPIQDFFASMILQQDKVAKLCLESFCTSKIIHFRPKLKKSPWTGTRFKQSKKYCSDWLSRAERNGEIENLNLAHAWPQYKPFWKGQYCVLLSMFSASIFLLHFHICWLKKINLPLQKIARLVNLAINDSLFNMTVPLSPTHQLSNNLTFYWCN